LNGYKLLDGEKIIHRDLKPENILINFSNKKPIYKIADFGVGKIYEENESAMTISKGTPAYAPPEINCLHQQKFGEIDEELYKNAHQICQNKSSVDIYSIGLILH
jgi:serine/threonine protein kinase